MDPFQKLPHEVLLHIVLSSETYQEASALSQSSPVVLSIWSQRFDLIARTFIRTIPDLNYLLQDYMALVLFPINEKTPLMTKETRVKAIESHLYEWSKEALLDPVKVRSTQLILDLLSLHSRLQLYIEDFLGKATSRPDSMSRCYRSLPNWAHTDFSQSLSNQYLAAAGLDCSYDIAQLPADERRRIFRSFLRHELICKIYSPQKGDSLIPPVHPPKLKSQFICICGPGGRKPRHYRTCHNLEREWPSDWFIPTDPFRHWDWNILELYEGIHTTSPTGDYSLLSASTSEVCMKHYFGTRSPLALQSQNSSLKHTFMSGLFLGRAFVRVGRRQIPPP